MRWPKGSCAIVLDEGFLFHTNESSFVETKRKPVDECDLWAMVSLLSGVFSSDARMLQHRGNPDGTSPFSWTIDFAARRIKAMVVDLDTRTPHHQIIGNIGAQGRIVADALARLNQLMAV